MIWWGTDYNYLNNHKNHKNKYKEWWEFTGGGDHI
jgi:hypothetical protein